jgi:carbohydrate kinase (thermoresistant glucokinase family)
LIIVVIGVSASGKSTLGRALAEALSWEFIEGDDFHPPANVAKMRGGVPLNDADRGPWLADLNRRIVQIDAGGEHAVLACSALKKRYRDVLRSGIRDIRFIYLCGNPALIRQRMRGRQGHFMPAGLLDTQIATLEPPEDAVLVRVDLPTEQQVAVVRLALALEDDA